jgi:hypothetical protein
MNFPTPDTENPTQHFQQVKYAAREALADVIAQANEAGWASQEIAVALFHAAESYRDANTADPDPADDPPIGDAVQQQIGHEEQFDEIHGQRSRRS